MLTPERIEILRGSAIAADVCDSDVVLKTNELIELLDAYGEVHECPKCLRKCKECDCTEARIAELERQLATAVEQEREACAAVADAHARLTAIYDYDKGWCCAAFVIAAAIRSRTTKQEGRTP